MRAIFSSYGLRCTQQRLALYEALANCQSHPTADELYTLVNSNGGPELSMATVYNTLEAFCEAGLCQKIAGVNGCCRYDADMHEHLHFKDRRTGKILDVPDEMGALLLQSIPQEVLETIEKRMGMRLTRLNVELIGERMTDESRSKAR
jgi:Fe2+ or Zn2+ uptake regulation protein